MIDLKKLFSPLRRNILSQLFVNLAAGWFGVVLIVPGVTQLKSFDDFIWLTKNVLFGILALIIAEILIKEKDL